MHRTLRALGRNSDKNQAVISSLKARPLLLGILFFDPRFKSSKLSSESLALLAKLQLAKPEFVAITSKPDHVAYLIGLLFHPCIKVRINVATPIEAVVAGI